MSVKSEVKEQIEEKNILSNRELFRMTLKTIHKENKELEKRVSELEDKFRAQELELKET